LTECEDHDHSKQDNKVTHPLYTYPTHVLYCSQGNVTKRALLGYVIQNLCIRF
jgi:hypothetical protein